MINQKEQLELFKLIGARLTNRVECLAIGGTAMMFYGTKEITKDVDLVFMEKKGLEAVKKALYEIGFDEKKNITIFKQYEIAENKPVMMEGKDTRFDLFLKEVISFKISDSILGRVAESHEFGNFIIKVVSPEDIILLKCATEREKDRIDAADLIKKFNIDWSIILNESIHQANIGGDLFPVFLFDFLFELKEDFKLDISNDAIKKVRKVGEKMMIDKIKKGTIAKNAKRLKTKAP